MFVVRFYNIINLGFFFIADTDVWNTCPVRNNGAAGNRVSIFNFINLIDINILLN